MWSTTLDLDVFHLFRMRDVGQGWFLPWRRGLNSGYSPGGKPPLAHNQFKVLEAKRTLFFESWFMNHILCRRAAAIWVFQSGIEIR